VVALDTDGDSTSEVAIGILDNGVVRLKVYDGGGTQQSSFNAATDVRAFGIGKLDINRDGLDDLQIAIIPNNPSASTGNQVRVVDPTTGTIIDGFDAFASLTGGISLDGN
jgi:hypothetical protein